MIRVGNSGGLQPALALGDLVITTGAVRDDGTSRSYVLPEYPAVADYAVVAALVGAARARGVRHAVGVTWSIDAFYARNAVLGADGAIETMSFEGYRAPELASAIVQMRAARVQNCEMESGHPAHARGTRSDCRRAASAWSRIARRGRGRRSSTSTRTWTRASRVATDAMLALVKSRVSLSLWATSRASARRRARARARALRRRAHRGDRDRRRAARAATCDTNMRRSRRGSSICR